MTEFDTLIVVRSESDALIRSEVRAAAQRERLERAVRDAVTKLRYSVDEVSEASGLTPDEIHRILVDAPVLSDDLAVLAGAC